MPVHHDHIQFNANSNAEHPTTLGFNFFERNEYLIYFSFTVFFFLALTKLLWRSSRQSRGIFYIRTRRIIWTHAVCVPHFCQSNCIAAQLKLTADQREQKLLSNNEIHNFCINWFLFIVSFCGTHSLHTSCTRYGFSNFAHLNILAGLVCKWSSLEIIYEIIVDRCLGHGCNQFNSIILNGNIIVYNHYLAHKSEWALYQHIICMQCIEINWLISIVCKCIDSLVEFLNESQ